MKESPFPHEGIMTALANESEQSRNRNCGGELYKALTFPWYRSEIELLHGLEGCPDLLLRAVQMSPRSYPRGRYLLNLWIKLGRPHPAVLRARLLALEGREPLPVWLDRSEGTGLVDWSYAAYADMAADSLAQSGSLALLTTPLPGTVEAEVNHRPQDQ